MQVRIRQKLGGINRFLTVRFSVVQANRVRCGGLVEHIHVLTMFHKKPALAKKCSWPNEFIFGVVNFTWYTVSRLQLGLGE